MFLQGSYKTGANSTGLTPSPLFPSTHTIPVGWATGRLQCSMWRTAVEQQASSACPLGHLSIGPPHRCEAAVSAALPTLDSLKIL